MCHFQQILLEVAHRRVLCCGVSFLMVRIGFVHLFVGGFRWDRVDVVLVCLSGFVRQRVRGMLDRLAGCWHRCGLGSCALRRGRWSMKLSLFCVRVAVVSLNVREMRMQYGLVGSFVRLGLSRLMLHGGSMLSLDGMLAFRGTCDFMLWSVFVSLVGIAASVVWTGEGGGGGGG